MGLACKCIRNNRKSSSNFHWAYKHKGKTSITIFKSCTSDLWGRNFILIHSSYFGCTTSVVMALCHISQSHFLGTFWNANWKMDFMHHCLVEVPEILIQRILHFNKRWKRLLHNDVRIFCHLTIRFVDFDCDSVEFIHLCCYFMFNFIHHFFSYVEADMP